MKVGCALLTLLIQSAKLESGEAAFIHQSDFCPKTNKRLGLLFLEAEAFKAISAKDNESVLPRYLPMLVPPIPWDRVTKKGGYYVLQPSIMRVHSKTQQEAVKLANIDPIIDALNYLGSIPWRINERVFNVP